MAADGTSIHTRRYNFWPPRGLTPSPTSSIYTHTESTTQSTLPYEDASTANSYITSGKQRATVTSSITPASKHSTDQLYSTTAKSTSTAGGGHITSAATSTRRSSKTIVTSGGQTSASAGAQTAFQSKDLTLTPHVHKAAIAGIVIGMITLLHACGYILTGMPRLSLDTCSVFDCISPLATAPAAAARKRDDFRRSVRPSAINYNVSERQDP